MKWLSGVALLMAAATAYGDPIQWEVGAGGNGHFYELVFPDQPISWLDARDAAATMTFMGVSGHLVTVTTAGENDFLRVNFASLLAVQRFLTGSDQDGDLVWLGLSDVRVEGLYEWITGEPFAFDDFGPFEPNNLGDQDYILARVLDDGRLGTGPTWQWDTNYVLPTFGVARLGYIVEYPVPEPSTLAPSLLCAAGIAWRRRRT